MISSQEDLIQGLRNNKAALLGVLIVTWLLYKIVYALFLSPTARVPGPLIDKISGIRLSVTQVTGSKMYFINRQLRKYGPLVEISPNMVACSDSDAIKVVYGSHKWLKSLFYSEFADFQSTPTLFSERRPKRAQLLRKAFLPAFSRANLMAMAPFVFAHLNQFLLKLDEFEQRGKPLECYHWFRCLTFQVITDVGFGAKYDMISDADIEHPFVKDFDDSVSFGILESTVGFLLRLMPKLLWPKSLIHWSLAADRTSDHAKEGLERWRAQKARGETGHRVDILQRLIDHGDNYPDEKLTEKELTVEIMEIMLAGGDTTASTVTYACYELTRFPQVQDKLRAALKEAVPDRTKAITLADLEGIQYLDWTIKEILRLHPTLPSALERLVPPEGAEIAGHQLKGGTVVCMSAYVQHQKESIFPSPESFEPERWAEETEEMRLNSLAFSSGPRSCVGQALATMQMKVHLGTILRHFTVKCHQETTPHSMEAVDFFQGKPRSGKCLLYFERDRT